MSVLDHQQTNQNGAKSSEINVLIKFVSAGKLRCDVRLLETSFHCIYFLWHCVSLPWLIQQ